MLPANRERADRAGQSAWTAVEYYMRGTVAVAAIHAVVMGITLTIIRAPLAVPIALIMFLAAFIPLVGVLLAGAIAVLVTLVAKGWVAAVVVLGILVVMNQLEGHLLQPQIVGKMVRLHPLAVILVLAVGGVVAGIAGAVVAVPITAALTRAVHELQRGSPPAEDDTGISRAPPGRRPRRQPSGAAHARAAVQEGTDVTEVLITRLDPGVPLPSYAHPGDAGVDLVTAEDLRLAPGQRALVRDRHRDRAAGGVRGVRAPALWPGREARCHGGQRAGHCRRGVPWRDKGDLAEHRRGAGGLVPAGRQDRPARGPASGVRIVP